MSLKQALESTSDKSGQKGKKKKFDQALKDGPGGEIMPPQKRRKVADALEPKDDEKN